MKMASLDHKQFIYFEAKVELSGQFLCFKIAQVDLPHKKQ